MESPPGAPPKALSPHLWVNTTYFTEGMPYWIIRALSTVFLTDIGADIKAIGYLNFLGIPWNWKFLWAPLQDTLGSRRGWISGMQIPLGLLTLAIAAICLTGVDGAPPDKIRLIGAILIVMAVLAATNDIAIDAYYLEGLPDRRDQVRFTGYRVIAYRIAMIFVRSGLVMVAALAAVKSIGWAWSFGIGGGVLLAMGLFHGTRLPRFERPEAGSVYATFRDALASYLSQERVYWVLLFIIVYRIGDEVILSMTTPFLMRELFVDKAQIAWMVGIIGAAANVGGTVLGTMWIAKVGLPKAIWPMTLLMNLNIAAYVVLAASGPDAREATGAATIAFVYGYEQTAAALGNAVAFVYLLGTCNPQFKAAHYAVGSAIMSIPSVMIGGFGGVIVEHLGYVNFFIAGFALTVPSMLLLFVVPIRDDRSSKPAEESRS